MSIAINPLIMSDDHPAIMFVNFFRDKINIDICWLNNGNTHPGCMQGKHLMRNYELGPSMQQIMT